MFDEITKTHPVVILYPKGMFGSDINQVMAIGVPGSAEDSHLDVLEGAWRMMNAVDGSDVERYLRKYRCRSMCAGDYACVDGTWYHCAMIGWEKVVDEKQLRLLRQAVSSRKAGGDE